MTQVQILYTNILSQLSDDKFSELHNRLPSRLKERNDKFCRWQDKHANLFGKLLLQESLYQFGYDKNCLDNLQLDKNNRPYVSGNIDFNISHSDKYVVCASGKGVRLGVDIEKIKEIDLNNFHDTMTKAQWKEIHTSNHPINTFYKYWSIKESVIKADGRGLGIPMKEIWVTNNIVHYDNITWFLKPLDINPIYSAFLATNINYSEINLVIRYIPQIAI